MCKSGNLCAALVFVGASQLLLAKQLNRGKTGS